jgi:UDP:flavonoid glycosyltransferase YjiC (YdhE family)
LKRRQYLIAVVDGGGNVPPELHAARRLIERGHAVEVLADDSDEHRVDQTIDELPWILALPVSRGIVSGSCSNLGEAITPCRPALVVCSMFCFGGMVAAEAARIPYVVLFPNIYPLPARGLPPFGIGLRPARGRLGQVRDAHRQLVMTSPALDFPATLPNEVRYVGPVLEDPVWSQGSSWTPSGGSQPLVLISMSSTFQDQIGTLQRVIAAMSTLPVQAIVTTGPAIDPAALSAAPNVTVLAHAPHREVLRHAVAVITHGGHGTVVKTLAAGVPMVLLPHGRDQDDTAVRVTARGAGIALKRTAPSEAIAAAVREILRNPTFRASAQQLGQSVRRDAGDAALLRELEDIPHTLMSRTGSPSFAR